MERIVAGTSGVITLDVYDADGNPSDADAAPSVVVYDGAGEEVDSGAASAAEHGGTVAGHYHYALPPLDTLDRLTAVWEYDLSGVPTTATTTVEVAQSHLFSLGQMRAHDPAFASVSAYPSERIAAVRVLAEQRLEQAASVAFTKRGRRATLSGNNRSVLQLPDPLVREVYAVSVDGEEFSEEEVAALTVTAGGGIALPDGYWRKGHQNVEVWYSHGMEVTPEPVGRAAIMLAYEALVPSAVPSRATSQSTEIGDFRLTIAGRDGYTGIPEVDAVIDQFGYRRPAVG